MKSQYSQDNNQQTRYYFDQLNKLKNHDKNYFKTIKITSTKDNTNFMDLTIESIPVIIQFLENELEQLKKAV